MWNFIPNQVWNFTPHCCSPNPSPNQVWNFIVLTVFFGIGAGLSCSCCRHVSQQGHITRDHRFWAGLHRLLFEVELPMTMLVAVVVWFAIYPNAVSVAELTGDNSGQNAVLSLTSITMHALNVIFMMARLQPTACSLQPHCGPTPAAPCIPAAAPCIPAAAPCIPAAAPCIPAAAPCIPGGDLRAPTLRPLPCASEVEFALNGLLVEAWHFGLIVAWASLYGLFNGLQANPQPQAQAQTQTQAQSEPQPDPRPRPWSLPSDAGL